MEYFLEFDDGSLCEITEAVFEDVRLCGGTLMANESRTILRAPGLIDAFRNAEHGCEGDDRLLDVANSFLCALSPRAQAAILFQLIGLWTASDTGRLTELGREGVPTLAKMAGPDYCEGLWRISRIYKDLA